MKDSFEKLVTKTLAEQLVRGYQYTDQYGGTQTKDSPLQVMVNNEVTKNKGFFVTEIAKIIDSKNIKKEVGDYIQIALTQEWLLKEYQKKFVEHFKTVIEEEVVKDLKVLLDGKKIFIAIE